MSSKQVAVFFFAALVLGTVALTASAAPANQWDVPDYTALSVKATTGPIETETSFREALEENFDAMDTDDDGKVSYAEALAFLPGLTQDVFYAVDSNGDGFITEEEAEHGAGCAGCSCSQCDAKKSLADLFLAGLSLSMLAAFSRRK